MSSRGRCGAHRVRPRPERQRYPSVRRCREVLATDFYRCAGNLFAGVTGGDGDFRPRRLRAKRELRRHVGVPEPAAELSGCKEVGRPRRPLALEERERAGGSFSRCTGSSALAARFERVTKTRLVVAPGDPEPPPGPAQSVALE